MRVDIWSDVVCPWCYVGKRRFETALAGFEHRDDVTVTWHSFELDPGASKQPAGGSHVQQLAAKFGRSEAQAQKMLDSMTETAAVEGLDFHFERVQGGNTFDAHRLIHLGAERGIQDAVKERFMRANFTDGRAISDHATLTELAVEAGLDRAEVEQTLASDAYAADVRSDEQNASQLGISGVPFFVIDQKYGISGAQPAEVLQSALTQAWNERSPITVLAGAPDAESCEGDACAI